MLVYASIGLSLLVLGVNLMAQSRMLLVSHERRPLLGHTFRLTYWVLLAVGVVFAVVGVVGRELFVSWIPIGITLIILAIGLVYQRRILIGTEGKLQALGRQLNWLAITYAILGTILVITVVSVTVFTTFCK
jgi:hypothetical protein